MQCVSSLTFTLQDIEVNAKVTFSCMNEADCTTIDRSTLQFDDDNLISSESQMDTTEMSQMVQLVRDLMDLETTYSQVTDVSAVYSVCAIGKTQ